MSQHQYEQLIHRQDGIIKALEMQISEVEQELFKREGKIAQLESDLEEICKEILSEVNLR